jgi:hypothetical protein
MLYVGVQLGGVGSIVAIAVAMEHAKTAAARIPKPCEARALLDGVADAAAVVDERRPRAWRRQ